MTKSFKYKIYDVIGTLSESDKSDWAKVISRVSWNDGDPQIDIRNMNLSTVTPGATDGIKFGKGISLSDKEIDILIKTLLREGYLDDDEIEEILNERKDILTLKPMSKKKIIVKIKRS